MTRTHETSTPSPKRSSPRRAAGWVLLAAAALVLALGLLGRRGPADEIDRGPRSLVLVTLDTTRADRLTPYGGDVPTPTLARLATEGVLYERAFSVAPITLVAHTSMLTGLWPPQHGVRNNGIHAAEDELHTLAERLGEDGWQTAAFVSAAVLERRYGLDQGFDVYDDDLSSGRQRLPRMVPDRPAEATLDSALEWLDGARPGRFFLWVHLYDPHAPYAPPAAFREALPGRPYDGEIAYLDAELARLMEHPRLAADETVVAVIGDHGESLGEHGEMTHALLAYDSTLHVPFLLRWPGAPAGARVGAPVSHVDLLPTLLDLLDRRAEPDLPGRSVVPGSAAARPAAEEKARLLYAETYLPHYTYGWAKVRTVRRGSLKFFDLPTPEVYDLRLDPRELSNLAEQQPGAHHDLARDLREWMAGFEDAERESAHELDAQSEAELRSLGYLPPGLLAESDGPPLDPKDVIDLHTGLERARQLQSDGLFDLAAAELLKVLERDPQNLAARVDLADNLARQGDLEGAAASLEMALASDPSSSRLHLQLSRVEARRGRVEQALALAERALELDPRQYEATLHRGRLLRRVGRGPEAIRALEKALEEHGAQPRLLAARAAWVLRPAGQGEAAEADLRRALELDPFLGVARLRLGEWLEADGRIAEAEEQLREGVSRQPRDPELQARYGLLLARRGRSGAETTLREAIRLASEPRSDLFLALAGWLEERGRAGEARSVYQRLAERPAQIAREVNNRAVALLALGRAEEARGQLQALLDRNPRSIDALANLAAVSIRLERWADAEAEARRLLALRGDLGDGWNLLGAALEGQGRFAEAIDCFERALEIDPGFWRARLNLAEAHLETSRPRLAEDALRSLLESHPENVEGRWMLAELLAASSDPGRAAEHYRRFLASAAAEDPRVSAARAALGSGPIPKDGPPGKEDRTR